MAYSAARLLRLLGLLQRRGAWSGPELAERLGVDARTLRRDVERLRTFGYLVAGRPGSAGGYRLSGGNDLPPLLLDDDEAMAVAVVLGLSASATVPGVERTALTALSKLDRVLPTRLRSQLHALRQATVPLLSPTEFVSPECLIELARGCEERLRATFSYRDHQGRESDRRVEPHRLVATERRWYLVAFDLDREDWRTFRVDRISSVLLPGHTFVARHLGDAARMVAEGISTAGYFHRDVVLVDASVADVAKRVAPDVGVISDDLGRARLEIGYDDRSWVVGFLVGLGLPFEVRLPETLRLHIRELGSLSW